MSRDLTAALTTEFTASSFRPILFFEGEFDGGFTRVWSGLGTIEWDSKSWTGVGYLGGISPIDESGDVRANGVAVSLSGIPSSLVSTALQSARQGLPGKIWIGALDSTGAVVADPYLAFHGRLDVPEIDDGGDTATITITYESRLIDLERPRERRYTAQDQRIDYSDDQGFDFVNSLQDKQLTWGRG
jgi:hypothetical protein